MNLTSKQKQVIAFSGLGVVVACPGSGKTETLVKRIEREIDEQESSLTGIAVLSFTNVGVDEISRRLNDDGYFISYPNCLETIDGFCFRYLVSPFLYLFTGHKEPVHILEVLEENCDFPFCWTRERFRHNCSLEQLVVHFPNQNDKNFVFTSTGKIFNECKAKTGTPCCESFRRKLFNRNVVSYQDLTVIAIQILKMYPSICDALRSRFVSFFIDEAQDSSSLQMELLSLLRGDKTKSFLYFGDYDQSIYQFRGADPEEFEKLIQSDKWAKLVLDDNFRCSQKICDAVYRFSHYSSPNHATGESRSFPLKPIALQNKTFSEAQSFFLDLLAENGIPKEKSCIVFRDKNDAILQSETQGFDGKNSPFSSGSLGLLIANAHLFYQQHDISKAMKVAEKVLALLLGSSGDIRAYKKDYIFANGTREWIRLCVIIVKDTPDFGIALSKWCESVIKILSEKIGVSKNEQDLGVKKKMRGFHELGNQLVSSFAQPLQTVPRLFYSTIHGVKGQSYDAVLLYMKKGNATLSFSLLCSKKYTDENVRLGYVAMTRAKKILVIASDAGIPDKTIFDNWTIEGQRVRRY